MLNPLIFPFKSLNLRLHRRFDLPVNLRVVQMRIGDGNRLILPYPHNPAHGSYLMIFQLGLTHPFRQTAQLQRLHRKNAPDSKQHRQRQDQSDPLPPSFSFCHHFTFIRYQLMPPDSGKSEQKKRRLYLPPKTEDDQESDCNVSNSACAA